MSNFEALTGSLLDIELHSADSTQLFTTARRNTGVNEGMQEFVEMTECVIRESSITCSCNTAEYDLNSSAVMGSTDFYRIAARGVEYHITNSNGAVTILAGDDFPRRDVSWRNKYQAGWRASTVVGTPGGYAIREDDGSYNLVLDTRPKIGSSQTAKLIVPYIPLLPAMTSTGEEPFSVGGAVRADLRPFHKATVHYAAHLLEKLRGDDEASDRQYEKFLSYVERWKTGARNKVGQFLTLGRSYLREASRRRSDEGDPRVARQWP
jgi:hypothetical protein